MKKEGEKNAFLIFFFSPATQGKCVVFFFVPVLQTVIELSLMMHLSPFAWASCRPYIPCDAAVDLKSTHNAVLVFSFFFFIEKKVIRIAHHVQPP